MKICLVTRVYPTQRSGGMPFVCEDRAKELAKTHDVHVITTALCAEISVTESEQDGLTIHYMPCDPCQWSAAFATLACDQVRALRPDVLHSDSFDRLNNWLPDYAHAKVKAVTMHGFGMGAHLTEWNQFRCGAYDGYVKDFSEMREEAKALAKYDVVIAISKWEEYLLIGHYGLANVRLVPNPISQMFFDTEPTAPTGKTFLLPVVGSAITKGLRVAIEAAGIAGVNVKHVKDLPRAEMVQMYDDCKAVVLPTYYAQGLDLTCAEAIVRRRPMIVSATGSYYWAFCNGGWYDDCGELVPVGDVKGFAAAMQKPMPEALAGQAIQHHPINHVRRWLEAVG